MSKVARAASARRDWGQDEEGCSILHVDMDAFFASVELARRPHLRGRPVVVGGADRAVVLAATYEARAFGIHSAMPMSMVKRLCPQAVVVPPDIQAYRAVSRSVMEILGDVTALVEQVSVDEAFLDVSGARRRLGPPTVIAEQIRTTVRDRHQISCSVGIASSKFVAKIASGYAKPDGVMLVPRASTVEFLRGLPVGALWGVGERTEASLARWGLTTVADIADSDVSTVQRAVGRVVGAHLHDLAWGRDPRPVEPVRQEKSISGETTFATDEHDLGRVQTTALELSDRCAGRLRELSLVARTVSIKVRTSDFRTLTRSRTLAIPTDVGREVYLAARDLLAAVDLGGLPVRLIGVRVGSLAAASERMSQPTLEEALAAVEDDVNGLLGTTSSPALPQRAAEQAMDRVRGKFGRSAIHPGSVARTPRADRPTTINPVLDLS